MHQNFVVAFCPSFCYNTFRTRQTICALIAQSAERVLGKDEVTSSNLVKSSRKQKPHRKVGFLLSLITAS